MTDLLKLTSLCQNLECEYILNAPMKDYTTFQIGGPCDILVRPYDEGQTAALIQFCAANGIRWQVIGNGSNLLVPDGGVSGAVIQIGSNFSYIRKSLKEGEILCAAGASLSAAAAFAQKEGLTGLEFAWGIPGNVGGALFMNAGAYGGEMKDVVVCADYVDGMGNTRTIAASEMQLGYRHSVFCENGGIVLSAEMQLAKGDQEKITENMKELNRRRVEKQPLNYPSAGSTFKRPEGYFAGKLIQDAGCRGLSVGGALVSPKHAGFIVNKGNATAQDILDLIHLVQLRVKDTFGVDLETEVRIIGE